MNESEDQSRGLEWGNDCQSVRHNLTASAAPSAPTSPTTSAAQHRTVLLHRLYRLARHALIVHIPLSLLLLDQRPRLADLD